MVLEYLAGVGVNLAMADAGVARALKPEADTAYSGKEVYKSHRCFLSERDTRFFFGLRFLPGRWGFGSSLVGQSP